MSLDKKNTEKCEMMILQLYVNISPLDRKTELLDKELDRFINGINTSNYKPKSTTWLSI